MESPTKPESIGPQIVYVPYGELKIYPVSEQELEAIERGGPESIFSSIGIACITTAISLTAALAMTEISSSRIFIIFTVITVIGYLASVVLGLLWWNASRSKKNIIKTIRERLSRPAGKPLMPLHSTESLPLPPSEPTQST